MLKMLTFLLQVGLATDSYFVINTLQVYICEHYVKYIVPLDYTSVIKFYLKSNKLKISSRYLSFKA